MIIISFLSVKKFSEEYKKTPMSLSSDVADALLKYSWPGNIRELENVIETAVVLCQSNSITLDNLPIQFRRSNFQKETEINIKISSLADMEKEIVNKLLDSNKQDKEKVSSILGITSKTLLKILNK